MRLEGPYEGGDPRIDNFEDWGWGEISINLDEALGSKIAAGIAATIWDEIIKEIADRGPGKRPGPYISTIGDDEPHLTVHILDTHCIIIPLTEIEFDSNLMTIRKRRDEAATSSYTDVPATLAMLEKTKAIFQGWIDQVDELAAEVKEEAGVA